ncbi:Breast cancer metastasis-suppressor 1-like protein [Triplophysa tibetana]|uniref:Breast cancer metastasis-suppressor 1-like protein n=1 Tax=Triplophysa tibetana TaxID=1572043 RepID=A0A5A9NIU8_9TELE|nr:Breast cancer metastasis-suppressor 1-like protein [Triplophysa tibetana]
MDVDYPEQNSSSSDEDDYVSSSESEDGDTSEMDDEDCERRRKECLDEMTNLEKQFTDLKDQRTCRSEPKLQSEKLLLFDTIQSELEEKIRRLEEDRHSIDITSELWNDGLQSRKNKKKDPLSPGRKKKPVVVSDIPMKPERHHHVARSEDGRLFYDNKWYSRVPMKPERHHHVARSEDGRLFYDNKWYSRGQTININGKDEYPTRLPQDAVHVQDLMAELRMGSGDLTRAKRIELDKGRDNFDFPTTFQMLLDC